MYYLGVDGGGTKTEFMLIDEAGHILSFIKDSTIDYKRIGREKFETILKRSINELCNHSDLNIDDFNYTFMGIPCFKDELGNQEINIIKEIVENILGNKNYQLGNDAEAGWAGSLACKPGINLVAGTGTIGFGKDEIGNDARASGWGHKLGDEGSAYWLGKNLLTVFTKESDGRKKKTIIYNLLREKLSLKNDYEIISLLEQAEINERKEIAELALILYEAAQKGDKEAINLYKEAAFELSQTVSAIINKLSFQRETKIKVSYSGGVFNAGDYIIKPLKDNLNNFNILLKEPILKPVTGAALYALLIDNNDIGNKESILENLIKEESYLD